MFDTGLYHCHIYKTVPGTLHERRHKYGTDVEVVITAAGKRPVLLLGQDERATNDDCIGQNYATPTSKRRHVQYLSETQSD